MINSYKNIIAICLCIFANILWAQTATTTASGLWGTASNWSRGTLPTSSSNALIDRAMTLSGTAITITASSTSYVYTINGVLNTPSGNTSSVYLNSGNVSGTATIDFRQDGTFRCTSSCASGTNAVTIGSTAGGSGGNPVNNLIIRSGATVYVFGDVEFNQNSSVLIEPGGALIVNGNITNKNNSDNITVNGILSVSGLASNNSNGIIVGSGSISAGSFNNGGGGATIFGSSTVCGSNCSMSTPIANCTSTTSTIAASQSICSVATPSALTASVTVPSTGSGYFFQWQVFTNSGWSGAPGTNGSITTVSSTSLISTYQPTTITASRAFRLLVTFTGCTSQLSNQITLSIGNFAASGTGTVSGSSSICSGTNSNYSVSGFVSATAYNWTVPTGVTIIAGAGTSSIVVTSTGSSTGLISVTGYNSCVSTPTSAASINVTLTSGVSGTGTINGSASQCQGTSTNYTVTGLSNVTTYNWTVPSGFTITSGSGTSIIGVSFTGAAASGDISISGNNTCGNGNRSKLTVTISPTVSGTGTINGSAAQCQGTSTNYTVTGLSNVTTYNWTVPSGFSITSGTGTSIIGVSFSGTAASGDISISGNNTCGNGNRSKLTVTITPTVSGTGTINGSASQCQGTSTNYTITGLTNVTTFNWTVPSGFSITSGTGTSIIGVSFSGTAASGDISISGNNTCGNGSTSKLTVTITPTVSGTALYAGTTSFCTSSTRNYTVSGISNFSSLTWSVPIGFTISSGQGTSIVGITSNSNVGGTVTLTAINTCGNYISTNLTLTYTSGSWLGITSDWNNSSNWCSGTVPISSSDVIISPTVSFMPVISSTGAIVNNLSIVGTGTISLNSGLTLSISGNFINSGTFNAASGSTVLFNGVGNQSISGSNTFSNLSISKSSTTVGVLLAANQSITGTLTLGNNSKIVTTGFSLTLVSNTTTTGRLAQVPSSAAYVGNITVQRYIPAKRTFRFIGSPVVGATFNDWRNFGSTTPGIGMYVTGNGTGSDAGSNVPTITPYLETVSGIQNIGFNPVTSGMSTPLTNGVGYKVFVRGDRTINLSTNYTPTNTVIQVSGTPAIGNVSPPISFTNYGVLSQDGWNLVSNPYPSQIDWNTGITRNNVDNAIYIFDPISSNTTAIGDYFTYVNGVSAGINSGRSNPSIIASSQAFFVKANAANPTLTFTENSKTGSSNTANFREESIPNLLYVTLNKSNTAISDNTAIRFDNNATYNFDSDYDAYKMKNSSLNISSFDASGTDLAINTFPEYGIEEKQINLNVQSATNGTYSLIINNLNSFENSVDVYLIDNYLQKTTLLSDNQSYTFDITSISGTQGSGRFKLVFKPQLGKVQVFIQPDTLTNSSWSLDNGTPQKSGTVMTNIPIGNHTISFAKVNNWKEPNQIQLNVIKNETTTIAGVYEILTQKNHKNSDYVIIEQQKQIDTIQITNKTTKINNGLSLIHKLYPNPISEGQILHLQTPEDESYTIELISSKGQIIGSKSGKSDGIIEINEMVNLTKGLYFIQYKSNNKNFVFKVLKQ